MQFIKKIILNNPKMLKIYRSILTQNTKIWKKFESSDDILKWLKNFDTKEEVYLALILANNILYYTEKDVKYCWKLILTNRVKLYLLNQMFRNSGPLNVESWFSDYICNKCIFVGYGKAGESGQFMAYPFKKVNEIEDMEIKEFHEFLHAPIDFKKIERIFLLDDFIGSGNQAIDTWKFQLNGKSLSDIHKNNPHLNFIYLVLAGFIDGKNKIEKNLPMKVILLDELDESFKCFSPISIIYKIKKEREKAEIIMKNKGKMLYKYPLGYDEMGLAIAFSHNTPNNSLPVIWKKKIDDGWHPLFERSE